MRNNSSLHGGQRRNFKDKGIMMEDEEALGGGMMPDENEGMEYFQKNFRKAMGRIEFRRFEGDNPRSWISRAERYFCHFRTPEKGKVELASLHFKEMLITGSIVFLRKIQHPPG